MANSITLQGQTVPALKLLVVNQGDATVSVIDAASNTWQATLYEGVPKMVGHEIATSPDGRYAFLPLYGDAGVGRPGTDGRFLLKLDLTANRVAQTLDFGAGVRPHCVLYEKGSGLLFVTTELQRSITIVDPAKLQIVGTIPTGQDQSHMLAISHDGKRGYTANVGPGTVSVLDLQARKLVGIIPIAAQTQRIAISIDDRFVITADQTAPRMAVIDTATNAVMRWIKLPAIGYGSAFTPDGSLLLVTLPGAGGLAFVDWKTMEVKGVVPIGPRPQEVLINPAGTTAYVSCFGSNTVAVVDLRRRTVTASVTAGGKADGMAFANQK